MTRVPAPLVIQILAQSGITVNASTLRNWRRRDHITRTRDGYDLSEVLTYATRRGLYIAV